MHTSSTPTHKLHDGYDLPMLGLGTWRCSPAETRQTVTWALEAGYKHVDTATIYGNEKEVGQALTDFGNRDNIFVTTKLWNSEHGKGKVRPALERSLESLNLEKIDLYLIHWPQPNRDLYIQTWEEMIQVQQAGLTTSIGVSNFLPEHLHRIITETGVKPVVNQIEHHPSLQQNTIKSACAKYGIQVIGYSPLGHGKTAELELPGIAEIAAAHNKTVAQVVLRWATQLGVAVIPKSCHQSRIMENLNIFDFTLDATQLNTITQLEASNRLCPDPATFHEA